MTETLLAWGVTPVACTRFCEQPDLPHVGGTKDPDVSRIAGLAPDLVVMCVEENRREDAEALADAGVATASLSIDALADVGPALRMLAALVDVPADAAELGAVDEL
ncbi:MAG TPA: helical backbone metal receptor, partial [Acidimicrobiales bacterium]